MSPMSPIYVTDNISDHDHPEKDCVEEDEDFVGHPVIGSDSDEDEVIFLEEGFHTIPGYVSLGAPTAKCNKCNAIMWKEERVNKNVKRGTPEFSLCCAKGQISLPKAPPTPYMMQLLNDPKKGKKFNGYHDDIPYVQTKENRGKKRKRVTMKEFYSYKFQVRHDEVLRLSYHLPGKRNCTFREDDNLEKVIQREKFRQSQLEAFFRLNREDKNARKYTYDEIPQHYVWNVNDTVWTLRKRGTQIGRLLYTHHSAGEIWYTINVTFFNDLAEKLDKELKDITEECVVIIIASAKVNQHDGATCLNNYHATRFYLNAEHYSVKAVKQRAVSNKFTEEVLEHEEENVAEMLTIAQIKKLTAEYIERKVRCQITVKKIDIKSNWYDNVCTTCGVEVNIVDGRYKCLICVRNIPYPDKRFRLAAVCNDLTGILPIVFPDEDIQRLTGINAFEIDNDENEVGDDIAFPPTLKAFEKKEYIVTLKIRESNINKSNNIYMATEINDPGESLGDHSPSKVQVMVTTKKTMCMDLEGTETTIFSPPTGKSSNKIRPRANTDPVQYEMDENVVLSKLKIIKTEKKQKTMASKTFDFFKDLRKGKYDWKVQARILNLWRGYTKKGEPFKAFNLFLLDTKRGRIHAFVPGAVAEDIEKQVELGVIYLIQNFTVKDYKVEDKFRCIKKEIQIVIGSDTTLKPLEENDVSIERCWFDFYDLEDLKPLGKQNTYLTDVIGVMEDHDPIGKLRNRHGEIQSQIKFSITDGRTSVKVTFWDDFAELFADTIERDLEHPLIIIIGSCRVTIWDEEVILANVGATTFYLNYDHYSVTELRKRLAGPEFRNINLSKQKYTTPMVYNVKDLKNLDMNDDEGNKEDNWPSLLQTLENKDYTVKIKCIQDNIGEKQNYYVATNIMQGFNLQVLKQEGEENPPHPISYTEPQVSGSSYHLGSFSG
ncbi:hypothetical protein POM88_029075 [Heracleum sosnowskyi]|uniref:Replication protein A 70 kDa DNA-binding subunit B/D first OB fold domain-containing protein n=1 Tax=Heracleum sosnowskyi TaxID=360622 RepID=A0AAD8HUS6_9APIA|nr:hypothetical protein POM88_029075 [Heracleum sosnowskyi]